MAHFTTTLTGPARTYAYAEWTREQPGSNNFWILPNCGGLRVECRHCHGSATRGLAETFLMTHNCWS